MFLFDIKKKNWTKVNCDEKCVLYKNLQWRQSVPCYNEQLAHLNDSLEERKI